MSTIEIQSTFLEKNNKLQIKNTHVLNVIIFYHNIHLYFDTSFRIKMIKLHDYFATQQ